MLHPPPTTRRLGFSLIELLVTIAVLALLIGIAFPVLSSFSNSGDRSKTNAMLRSLAGAADEYNIRTGNTPSTVGNAAVTVGGNNDDTIGFWLFQTLGVPEVENMINSATKQSLNKDYNDNGTEGENFADVVILDAWGNPIRYASLQENSDGFNADDYLPAYPRPFFASAGPDGEWGSVANDGTPNDAAADNLYSFDAD
jgi:prepilin-type N-terminal cleavage/methylation domain-containing protein